MATPSGAALERMGEKNFPLREFKRCKPFSEWLFWPHFKMVRKENPENLSCGELNPPGDYSIAGRAFVYPASGLI